MIQSTMQREKQQPFFKPLNTTEYSNTYSLDGSQPRSRTPSGNLRETTMVKNAQKIQQQELHNGSEKLSTLHAKLHQEADRIRKWKIQTEIDLKQKDTKLHEATQTVESLRKSILELQLQNENLSLKLQEEMDNREEIMQKINATRDMCNLLKEHSEKVEETLLKCETERTELKYLEKEHFRQFEDLSASFKKMEITSREDLKKLQEKIASDEKSKEEIEKMLEEKLREAETQLKELLEHCEEKDVKIQDINIQLRKDEEKFSELGKLTDNLHSQIESLSSELESKDLDIQKKHGELMDCQNELKCIQDEVVALKHDIDQERAHSIAVQEDLEVHRKQTEEEMKSLRSEIENVLSLLVQEKQKSNEFHNMLLRTESELEDMKSSKDLLMIEKTEVDNQMKLLENERNDLLIERDMSRCREEKLNITLSDLESEVKKKQELCVQHETKIDDSQREISEWKKNCDVLSRQLENEKTSLSKMVTEISCADKQNQENLGSIENMKQEIENLNRRISDERQRTDEQKRQATDLKKQLDLLNKEIKEQNISLQKYKAECEASSKANGELQEKLQLNEQKIGDLNEEISCLKEMIDEQKRINEDLTDQKEANDQQMHSELLSKSKSATEMSDKNKELKSDLSSKNKQIKDLEKEIRSLTTKHTKQSKLVDEKVREIEKLQSENNCILENLKEAEEKVEQEKRLSSEKSQQAEMMREECEKAVIGKNQSVLMCEQQIAEMTSTLDRYKQENQKIVSQKEKEIEKLKEKNKLMRTSEGEKFEKMVDEIRKKSKDQEDMLKEEYNGNVEILETTIKDLRNEVKERESKLELEDKMKKNLTSELKDLKKQILCMKKELKTKEKERDDALEQLQMTPSKDEKSIQTSPVKDYSTKTNIQSHGTQNTPNIKNTPKLTNRDWSSNLNRTPLKSYSRNTPNIKHTPKLQTEYSDVNNSKEIEKISLKTPLSNAVTPQIQKSILRDSSSSSKKRRVAFASDDEDSGSDSSSSELMEVELTDVNRSFNGTTVSTPLLIKPSPRVKNSPYVHDSDFKKHNESVPLNRKPRAPPVDIKKHREDVKKNKNEISVEDEISKYKERYLDKTEAPHCREKENAKPPANVRKTPIKSSGKFFKSSPKEKRKKKPKEDANWFDIDTVFGFGPED